MAMGLTKKGKVKAGYRKAENLVDEVRGLRAETQSMIKDREMRYKAVQKLAEKRIDRMNNKMTKTVKSYQTDPGHADRYDTRLQKQQILLNAFEKTALGAARGRKELKRLKKDLKFFRGIAGTMNGAVYGTEHGIGSSQIIGSTAKVTAGYMRDISEKVARHDKELAGSYNKIADRLDVLAKQLKTTAPKPAAKPKAKASSA